MTRFMVDLTSLELLSSFMEGEGGRFLKGKVSQIDTKAGHPFPLLLYLWLMGKDGD